MYGFSILYRNKENPFSDHVVKFPLQCQAAEGGNSFGKIRMADVYKRQGMHGTKTSNFGITEADLLIVVGARFSDRVTGNASKFAKNAKILQIDIDRAEINKNIHVDARIIGDAKVILRKLNARLDPINHDEWIAHIERMKDMYPLRYDKSVLTGPFIIQTINEMTKGDAVIVTEVGQHQMWAAQYYEYRYPRSLLTSGGLGTMGLSLIHI